MKKVLLSAVLLFAGSASAHDFMPENNLDREDNLMRAKTKMTEEIFNEAITEAEEYYKPIVESHGGKLEFNREWDDSTVNASASQMGKTWEVNMYGGLARRKEVTRDGFQMVVCHEMGHHLAGYAFVGGMDWAANEGESDYFSAQSCARELWKDEAEKNAAAKEGAHPTAIKKCDEAWSEEADRNLCYRVTMAGKSLADLLGALNGDTVDFDTPDEDVVSSTDDAHPAAQCRLDSYVAGAVCTTPFDPNTIPGKDHSDGQDSAGAEDDAMKYSCVDGPGARPKCWFASVKDKKKDDSKKKKKKKKNVLL